MRLALILTLAARAFACELIEGDRVLGKDLAAANPAFAALDPNLVIGAAPLAGVRRVFRAEEIFKIARQNGISAEELLGEVCFERVTETLTPEKLLPVLARALALEAATIEILDYSRYGVPRGTLEFTRAGLTSTGLWRGWVAYAEGRSASVWVKVRVTAEATWVEATGRLEAHQVIDAAQLVVRKGPRFPFGVAPAGSLDLVAGRVPLRAIAPGVPIYASMIQPPREVERGDTVSVQVASGAAWLAFEGTAESAGRLGESILVRNPENGWSFQARVQAKGKVLVKK
jgi:flagella basal body P-ring formation protein FlgA